MPSNTNDAMKGFQTIGYTGITAGIVLIDENYLEELAVDARQCAVQSTKGCSPQGRHRQLARDESRKRFASGGASVPWR